MPSQTKPLLGGVCRCLISPSDSETIGWDISEKLLNTGVTEVLCNVPLKTTPNVEAFHVPIRHEMITDSRQQVEGQKEGAQFVVL